MGHAVKRLAPAVALALALVAALAALYPPIAHPPDGDAAHYLAMARGAQGGEAPFAYRVAVPWLVGALPFPAPVGFALVTGAGLIVAVVATWAVGARLGLPPEALRYGLVAAATTSGFAHHLRDPYLTDGAGLAVVALLLLAWQRERLGVAMALMAVGSLVRETTLLLGLLWGSRRQWRGAAALVLLGALVHLGVRHLPGMPAAPSLPETFAYVLGHKGLRRIGEDALGAWHVLWLLAAVGAARAQAPARRQVGTALVVLLGTGLALSLVALNTNRMLTFAWPAVALGTALFYESSPGAARRVLHGLLAVCAGGLLLWFPNRLTGDALLRPGLRAAFGGLAVTLGLAATWLGRGGGHRESAGAAAR